MSKDWVRFVSFTHCVCKCLGNEQERVFEDPFTFTSWISETLWRDLHVPQCDLIVH